MRARARATLMGLATMGICWIGVPGDCRAQGVESLGVRALGMGGAFVAVADDATATYWNPAGLATGAFVSAVIDRTQETGRESGGLPSVSTNGSGTFVGLSLPPIGISYYRLRAARILPNDAEASLVTQHVGVTLVQSIGDALDVAGTIKYVHGDAGVGKDTVDADLGALAHVGAFRAGLVVRNLRQPTFDAPNLPDAFRLDRQVRAGVAWLAPASTTLSCDVDLTRTDTGLDVRRHVAVGAEHLMTPRLAVRGGFRVNTIDDARPAGSAGVSVAVRPSIWLDAQITRGGHLADRTWGVAARMGF